MFNIQFLHHQISKSSNTILTQSREEPSPSVHNNLHDFALFIAEFIPMNIGALSPQGFLGTLSR
jgi:hypothetical protein